jgi:acyl-CoA synthetase (NDP forming)
MKKFLEPESVAVIGASPDPRKGGYALVANLKESFPQTFILSTRREAWFAA